MATDSELKATLVSVIEDAAQECLSEPGAQINATVYRAKAKELKRLAKALKKASTRDDAFQRYVNVVKDAESKGVLGLFYSLTKKSLKGRDIGESAEPQAFLDDITKNPKREIAAMVRARQQK